MKKPLEDAESSYRVLPTPSPLSVIEAEVA
jgi:hypothetical protein